MWLYGVFSLLFDLITHSVNPDGSQSTSNNTKINSTTTPMPNDTVGFHVGDVHLTFDVEHPETTKLEAKVKHAIAYLKKKDKLARMSSTQTPKSEEPKKTKASSEAEVSTAASTVSSVSTSESTTAPSTTESSRAATVSSSKTEATTKTGELTESITSSDGRAKDLKKELENIKTLSEVENSLLDRIEAKRALLLEGRGKSGNDENVEIEGDEAKTLNKRENQNLLDNNDETIEIEQKDKSDENDENDQSPRETSDILNEEVYHLINEANENYLTADDGVVKLETEEDEGQKWKILENGPFWELLSVDGVGRSKGVRFGHWILKPVDSKPGLFAFKTFEDPSECLSKSEFDEENVALVDCYKAIPWRILKG